MGPLVHVPLISPRETGTGDVFVKEVTKSYTQNTSFTNTQPHFSPHTPTNT